MSQTIKSLLKNKLSVRCIKMEGDQVPSPKNTPPSIERRGKSRSSTPKQTWKFDNDLTKFDNDLTVDTINVTDLKITCQ